MKYAWINAQIIARMPPMEIHLHVICSLASFCGQVAKTKKKDSPIASVTRARSSWV